MSILALLTIALFEAIGWVTFMDKMPQNYIQWVPFAWLFYTSKKQNSQIKTNEDGTANKD